MKIKKIGAVRRRVVLGSVIAIVSVGGFFALQHVTEATAGDILVSVSQVDGTPTWDADDAAGHDSGPSNYAIRTNDTLTYNVEIKTIVTQTKTQFSIAFPQGVELSAVPAFCGAGSSLSPTTMPAPTVPVTTTSYQSLPIQTLTCVVGDRAANSTFTYPVPARVRPEVPNGTALTLGNVTVKSAENQTDTIAAPTQGTKVSARAQYDLSKNGIASTSDSGYFYGGPLEQCPQDKTRYCRPIQISILISAPTGGKGISPLASPITLTDNLSPDALFPAGYQTNPKWIAAGTNATQKYGAVLSGCTVGDLYSAPGANLAYAGNTVENSVRNSGSVTCTQGDGVGTPVSISITDADTTAYTYPTKMKRPEGTLPADKAYVVAATIRYDIPVDTIRDLGVTSKLGNGGSSTTLKTADKYENFTATSVDGTPNYEPDTTNNYRTINYTVSDNGGFSSSYNGVPNYPNNTPPYIYNPSSGDMGEGLPGSDLRLSGNISAMATQPVTSMQMIRTLNIATASPISVATCKYQLI